jgi:glycosyltransferase involved in cell wall biosynthesis
VVTCNDVDAILPMTSGKAKRFDLSRGLARRVLGGLRRAERVACISHATERRLLAFQDITAERVSVAYLGVHPSCSPAPDPVSDAKIGERLGPKGVELLHVGSTIPRKRIEMLLQVFRGVLDRRPDVRLLRVGDPFTPRQDALARSLGVAHAIVALPFLERRELASVYRRAALLLMTSEREGFGLPVVESMACGTPVVASAIPALMEVGGAGAAHCPQDDLPCWIDSVMAMLEERERDPLAWELRRQCGVAAAARFDWRAYASQMSRIYEMVYRS